MGWVVFVVIVTALVVIFYVVNHSMTVEELKCAKENYKNTHNELLRKNQEIAELKRFSKPSDPSRLNAALSEIADLKARLRQTEASEADAKQKLSYLNSRIDSQEHYKKQWEKLVTENKRLSEELKRVKESKPRPKMVYSDDQVKAQVDKSKNQLNQKEEEVKTLKYEMSQLELKLEHAYDDLEFVEDHNCELQQELEKLKKQKYSPDEYSKLIRESVSKVSTLPFAQLPNDFKESIESGRLNNAFNSNLMILDKLEISAKIKSDKQTYNTTLHSCDCYDRKYRGVVCKHILFLSYTSGLLLLNKEVATKINLQSNK